MNMSRSPFVVVVVAVSVACVPPPRGSTASTPSWVEDTSSYGPRPTVVSPANPNPTIADPYREVAARIIAAARAEHGAFLKLAELADGIGARPSGSPELGRAIEWAVRTLKSEGHEARTETVMVPHWVRGHEEASITAPVTRPLRILGLGGTIATPKGGLSGQLVVVTSFDDLERRASEVKGKVVLYDVPLPAYDEHKGSGYGDVAPYRGVGASRAAKHGAIAVLVRSVTAHSLRSPHTGSMSYLPDHPRIPAAAVTVEDAMMLSRMAAKGPVTVRLRLEARQLPDAESANVIGELRGRERPDEIVLIGAHLDSWDVGQGAHDDGAGCVMVMHALTVLKRLGLTPRRTIRVVLFTNEEAGLRGAKAYATDHAAELAKHVFAFEADIGGFSPRGLGVDAKPDNLERVVGRMRQLGALAESLGVRRIEPHYPGADIAGLVAHGVPAAGLLTDHRTYFDLHHTEADTLDKVDPQAIADNVGFVAMLAYVIAELPGRLDEP